MSRRDRGAAPPCAPASPMSAEQHAFALGKASMSDPRSSCPYGTRGNGRQLIAAWWRGRRYQSAMNQGLRPLDTARRIP